MKKYVFDSYALLAYCEGEKAGVKVKEILKKASLDDAKIYISVVNFGEMYYIALREGGKERAEQYRRTFVNYPVEILDADMELTLTAAKYKAMNKMSYADAFAAAVADLRKAVLVTGDKEFEQLGKQIKIEWI